MNLTFKYNLKDLHRVPVVYAVQLAPNGPIKIGATNDLVERYRELQSSNPFPLQLIAARRYTSLLIARTWVEDFVKSSREHVLHTAWLRPEALPKILEEMKPVPFGTSVVARFKEPIACPTSTPQLPFENAIMLADDRCDSAKLPPRKRGRSSGDTATVTWPTCSASPNVACVSLSKKGVSIQETSTVSAPTGSTVCHSKTSKLPKKGPGAQGRGGI